MIDKIVRCSKCILPATTPEIEFDNNGICSYCMNYKPMEVKGEGKLSMELEKYRSVNGKYDCMVSISGGRDSTYTMWKMVNDYGLKVLATNYKNPFTSEQASENIENTVKSLGIECIYWEFPNDVHRKDTVKALKTWLHHPSASMIPIICSHCKSWWPTFFRLARENGIKLIVIGSNPLETASFKQAGFGGARTYHKLSKIPGFAVKVLKELLKNPRYLTHCSYGPIFKAYFMASHSSPYLKWMYKDITVIRLFDYIKWNEKEVHSVITSKLDWKKSPESESSWRFDCRLDYVRRLMYSSTVGVSELQDLMSKMIREGQISREEALHRLESEDMVKTEVVEDVLDGLGMNMKDLKLNIG